MTNDIRKFMKLVESALVEKDEPASGQPATDANAKTEPAANLPRNDFGRAMHPGIMHSVGKNKYGDQLVATLTSYNSQVYTKLAQKVLRMNELEAEIKKLKEEVKAAARSDIADLFSAADIVSTRVVETQSFMLELSKVPKATATVKYASVFEELEQYLAPDLIMVLGALKQKFTSFVNKEASLKVRAKESLGEGVWDRIKDAMAQFKAAVLAWGTKFDSQLAALRADAGLTESSTLDGIKYVEESIDKEVAELQGFHVGDTVTFTWTGQNPGSFRGKIEKLYDTGSKGEGEAWVEFQKRPPCGPRVKLHWCRTNAQLNKQQAISDEQKVHEAVEGEFAVGTTITYNATEESPPGSYQGKITKMLPNDEAVVDWNGRSPKSGSSQVALHWCTTNAMQNRLNAVSNDVHEGVDYGRVGRIEKQVDFMAGRGRSRQEIVANILSRMGDEESEHAAIYFDEIHGVAESVTETMAFPLGTTVYCGSRAGKVIGDVSGVDDAILVELPNGEQAAFKMKDCSNKKPGILQKAASWMVGEDDTDSDDAEPGLTEGPSFRDQDAEDDARSQAQDDNNDAARAQIDSKVMSDTHWSSGRYDVAVPFTSQAAFMKFVALDSGETTTDGIRDYLGNDFDAITSAMTLVVRGDGNWMYQGTSGAQTWNHISDMRPEIASKLQPYVDQSLAGATEEYNEEGYDRDYH